MQAVMNSKAWVRRGITIGKTTVAADPGGIGVFAPELERGLHVLRSLASTELRIGAA